MSQQSSKYIESVGSFECVVSDPGTAGWFAESKESKTPYIRIPFTVKDGPAKGRIGVYCAWLTDAAFDNTIKRLKEVFGFNGDLDALYNRKINFTGMPCNIQTESETYQGKTRFKVAWLNPPGGGGGGLAPIDKSKASSLLAKLSSRAKAIAKTAESKVDAKPSADPTAAAAGVTATTTVSGNGATTEVSPSGPPEDDDVPF
jgi:hypothetical protein